MPEPAFEYAFVNDAQSLGHLSTALSDERLLALDTEFIRERTYFPELCVLQVATPRVVAAVDCLAPLDLAGLFEVLLREDKTWILHSARQDLEVLFMKTGKLPRRLIDTQIAAGLIGMPAQIGLQGLLEDMLGIRISKQHTRADWSRRPLPDALIQYALDDVRYLFTLWDSLRRRLESLGRESWFEEDCERQLGLPIEPDVSTLFERAKGTGSLRGASRAAAFALLAWREERAKNIDKPRRWVLGDDQLVRIAAAAPGSMTELEAVRDLPRRLAARSGHEILAAIREAEPMEEAPDLPMPDARVVKSLQQDVRKLAESLGIQPELLATRRDIAAAAGGSPPDIVAAGWRHEILGEVFERISRDRVS